MNFGAISVDKKLDSVLRRAPISKAYFRAGVLFSVACSTVAVFSLSYAISSGLLISLETPMFVVALSALVLLLLSLVYMAVVCALEKRNLKLCVAEGKISESTLISGINMDLKVTRRGTSRGYSAFQVALVYSSILSLLVVSGVVGTILGAEGVTFADVVSSVSNSVSIVTNTAGTGGILLKIGCSVLLASVTLLFFARIFAEESKSSVQVLVFPDCCRAPHVSNYQDRGCDEQPTSVAYDGSECQDIVAETVTSRHALRMLEGARSIRSILNDGEEKNGATSITAVECVISCFERVPASAPL